MKINLKRNLIAGACSLLCCLSLGFAVGTLNFDANATTDNEYLLGASLSLTDDIIVRIPVTAPTGYTNAEMIFNYKGQTYTQSKQVEGGVQTVFTFDKITPQNLTEQVDMTLKLTGEGQTDVEESVTGWSIKDYCDNLLANKPQDYTDGKYEDLKALTVNLLNYGGKAQTFVGKDGSLPTDGLSSENLALIGNTAPINEAGLGGTSANGVVWKAATLEFDNKINLVFEFQTSATGEIGFTADGKETGVTVSKLSENTYQAVYNVPVVDFDEVLAFNVTVDGVATGYELYYGVGTYAARIQAGDYSQSMKDLAFATYNYGLSAAEFDGAIEMPAYSYSQVGEYIEDCTTPSFQHELLYGYTGGVYADSEGTFNALSAATSDGEYIYGVANAKSAENNTTARIFKLDMNTGLPLGCSAQYTCNSQGYPIIYVKDGYVYVHTDSDVKKIATTSLTTEGGALEEATDVPAFIDDNGATLTSTYIADDTYMYSIQYSAENNKYVVLVSGKAHIYSASGEYEKTLSVVTYKSCMCNNNTSFNAWEVQCSLSKDYIYLYYKNHSQNTYLKPDFAIYDWDGNCVSSSVIIDQTLVAVTGSGWMKGRTAIVVGKYVYGFYSNPQGGNYVAMTKSTIPVTRQTYDQFGEYLVDCGEGTPNLSYSLVSSWSDLYTAGGSSYNSVAGSTTDGKYIYAVVAGQDAERGKVSRIFKINPADGKAMAFSEQFTAVSGTNATIFLKDGYLYACVEGGEYKKIALSALNDTTGGVLENATVPTFLGADGQALTSINDVSYNAENRTYVVSSSGKIYIYNRFGGLRTYFTVQGSRTWNNGSKDNNVYNAHISTTKDYVYISYHNDWCDGYLFPRMAVYDWSGNLVKNVDVDQNVLSNKNYSKLWDVLVIGDTIYGFATNFTGSVSTTLPAMFKAYTTDVKD